MGDECTRFFHAKASVKNRINYISSLTGDSGQIYSDHDEKARIIWEAFKDRMGRSEFRHMNFDLEQLLVRDENLE